MDTLQPSTSPPTFLHPSSAPRQQQLANYSQFMDPEEYAQLSKLANQRELSKYAQLLAVLEEMGKKTLWIISI